MIAVAFDIHLTSSRSCRRTLNAKYLTALRLGEPKGLSMPLATSNEISLELKPRYHPACCTSSRAGLSLRFRNEVCSGLIILSSWGRLPALQTSSPLRVRGGGHSLALIPRANAVRVGRGTDSSLRPGRTAGPTGRRDCQSRRAHLHP